MQRFWAGLIGLALIGVASIPAAVPLDRPKLENYLRYAEGFSPSVKFVIDDPVPIPIPGYYRLVVHLSMGETKQDKVYYLTSDGKLLVTGPIWDLNRNPFWETVQQLPTSGPSFGPENAKVKIVVFSDFECPYCREFAHTIRENIPQKYPKDVRVIFEDFPIDSLHPWARAAAEASHCLTDGEARALLGLSRLDISASGGNQHWQSPRESAGLRERTQRGRSQTRDLSGHARNQGRSGNQPAHRT